MPSITVDNWGGVHVLYYVGWKVTVEDAVEWRYQVKLLSIKEFSVFPHPTTIATGNVSKLNVHPQNSLQYFTLDHPLVVIQDGYRKLGDYNLGASSRWCEIYASYIAREPDSSVGPRAYASRIVLDPARCLENPNCYASCDGSTISPILNVTDFTCFLQRYAQGCANPSSCYANCDGSTQTPFLNVSDFTCFLQAYAAGCN